MLLHSTTAPLSLLPLENRRFLVLKTIPGLTAEGNWSLGRLLGRSNLGYKLDPPFLVIDVKPYSPNISLLQFLNLWVQVKLASLLGTPGRWGLEDEASEVTTNTASILSG